VRSTNWIGDAIMTTPAIRAIRKAFPVARITLLAKPWVIPVFESSPHVDDLMVYDEKGRHGGMVGKVRLARDLGRVGFEASILLQNAVEAAIITRMAGIPIRLGYDTDARRLLLTHAVRTIPEIKKVHQTGYYLHLLREAGLPAKTGALHLTLDKSHRSRAMKILQNRGVAPDDRIVGLNPSAAFGSAKQWFPHRFADAANQIQTQFNTRTLIFGGPADRELGSRIARLVKKSPVDLSGQTTLSEAMALIDRCSLFITNDSGLMHVAAALNKPLVAIFGSTNPVTTGPFSSNSRVIQSRVACSPCLKPVCQKIQKECMVQIDTEQVVRAAGEML